MHKLRATFERRPVDETCLSCASRSMTAFYSVEKFPVQSLNLCSTFDRALLFPRGRVRLAFCERCGFISNIAFDPSLTASAPECSPVLTCSPSVNPYADRLIDQLVGPLGIRGKHVLEIGCGTGRFLTSLCQRGGNTGVGLDKSYVPDGTTETMPGVEFIPEDFSDMHTSHAPDVVICRMVLAQLVEPLRLLRAIRRLVGDRKGVLVLFQVPNMKHILRKAAFWDICYEHPSYYTSLALAGILQRLGFEVRTSWIDATQQHLIVLAEGGNGTGGRLLSEGQTRIMLEDTERFAQQCDMELRFWRMLLRETRGVGERSVLWGGGAKGVSFLCTLGLGEEIDYVVDIDPQKQSMYMPGSGHRVVDPEYLREHKADLVLIMNNFYTVEIRENLARMNIFPVLRTIE
jgi:2-polyprenyl-3-methyl-5-hydroxy-6-metoxy-1,4-benzoquinol methylase